MESRICHDSQPYALCQHFDSLCWHILFPNTEISFEQIRKRGHVKYPEKYAQCDDRVSRFCHGPAWCSGQILMSCSMPFRMSICCLPAPENETGVVLSLSNSINSRLMQAIFCRIGNGFAKRLLMSMHTCMLSRNHSFEK